MSNPYTPTSLTMIIKAVREAYDKHPSKSVSTKVIITFLNLILTLNNFIFNIHYLQVMG